MTRPLPPRSIRAIATVLAHVHGYTLDEAERIVREAVEAGARGLNVEEEP